MACATGNDIRALEAGAHAYASRSGVYRPITCWERTASGDLEGMIELPMAVGIVGGTTRTHPMAGLLLRMMHVESAAELGMVIAGYGSGGKPLDPAHTGHRRPPGGVRALAGAQTRNLK